MDALDFDDILSRLEANDPRVAQVVELRCFGGLSHAEIAQCVGVDERTVKRDWQLARAWIRGQLKRAKKDRPDSMDLVTDPYLGAERPSGASVRLREGSMR